MTALQPIIVDAWQFDGVDPLAGPAQLAAAGEPWSGMIVQATHGNAFPSSWFTAIWPNIRKAGGTRYGRSWWRGAYHYLIVGDSVRRQAQLFDSAIQSAGGYGDGDLWPAVDVESGDQPPNVSAAQVEDSVSTFADELLKIAGTRPMLYAGSWVRDLGIRNRMGCALLWFPEWTGRLDWSLVRAMGWDMDSTLLWQIVGDGSNTAPPGYPHVSPIGPLDLSVMVRANLPAAAGLEWTRTHARASTPV